jgi:hypothetical protein
MRVKRSQWWWKEKTWYSDVPITINEVAERIKLDAKTFSEQSGLSLDEVNELIRKAIDSNFVKEIWYKKFGWTMYDWGEIESSEFKDLTVAS